MHKGLFKVESMQKSKKGNLKSYSKKRVSYAKSFAVCFAIVTLVSCGEKTGNSMFHTVKMLPMLTGHTCSRCERKQTCQQTV